MFAMPKEFSLATFVPFVVDSAVLLQMLFERHCGVLSPPMKGSLAGFTASVAMKA